MALMTNETVPLNFVDISSDPESRELEARNLRVLEALIFASSEPVVPGDVQAFLSDGADTESLLLKLQALYEDRGVNLVKRGTGWAFRTAEDLSYLLRREETETRPMTRPSLETLAIIAYHQPVTRAEIEEVRGVSTGRGTLDILMEAGWIRMRGRRRTPGRPVTYGTTAEVLDHFSLEGLGDLRGLDELKGAGLLSSRLPPDMTIPLPTDGPLGPDEDPLDGDEDVREDNDNAPDDHVEGSA
jgi:segregation and condensation protein B